MQPFLFQITAETYSDSADLGKKTPGLICQAKAAVAGVWTIFWENRALGTSGDTKQGEVIKACDIFPAKR